MRKGPPAGSHLLLLTACISPKQEIASLLQRSDPEVRLRDYSESLRFWIGLKDPRIRGIVFADNSGYPLDKLRDLASQIFRSGLPVEFHSFDHPSPQPGISYGYSEVLLVNAALAASPLAAQTPYFAKITGRYQYPGFSRLMDRLPSNYKVALDTTGERPWPWSAKSNPMSSFALALFQTDFYRHHLTNIPEHMQPAPPWNRRQFVESMLYDQLHPLRRQEGVILRWPCNCEPVGIGANGTNLQGLRRRRNARIRAFNRLLFPWLWL